MSDTYDSINVKLLLLLKLLLYPEVREAVLVYWQ